MVFTVKVTSHNHGLDVETGRIPFELSRRGPQETAWPRHVHCKLKEFVDISSASWTSPDQHKSHPTDVNRDAKRDAVLLLLYMLYIQAMAHFDWQAGHGKSSYCRNHPRSPIGAVYLFLERGFIQNQPARKDGKPSWPADLKTSGALSMVWVSDRQSYGPFLRPDIECRCWVLQRGSRP